MKIIALSILVAGILIGGAVVFTGSDRRSADASGAVNNVTVVDGKQIITITAKGGYSPRVTAAKAGLQTVLKVDTKGTFDCASRLTIPSLNYSVNLPPSGETLIDVPPQKAGTAMTGLCAMGMYNFTVNFN